MQEASWPDSKEQQHAELPTYDTKVKLTDDVSDKGKIALHYYFLDDLTRVLELLLGR